MKVEPWLAQTLRQRWKSYRQRLQECQEAPSEESIHELRVAIRRLTSQITLLDCVLPGNKPQRALRMLKRQLKSLGHLRDHHVQQVFLANQAARFPELLRLHAHFERQEGKLMKVASRQISRFRAEKLEKWVRALIKDLAQHSSDPQRQTRLSVLVIRHARKAFSKTVERRRAIDFSDLSTIHRTRVAFKRFRYIMESLPPNVTGLSKRDLRTLACYQRRMGHIQDLEVIQSGITDLIHRYDSLEDPLAPFSTYLRRRRARALLSFRKSVDSLFQFWPSGLATARSIPMIRGLVCVARRSRREIHTSDRNSRNQGEPGL